MKVNDITPAGYRTRRAKRSASQGWMDEPDVCYIDLMRKKPLFGLFALVLGVALCFSPAAAQNAPLLSPAPTEEEDPVAVTIAWSVDRIHPTGDAVLAVVLDIRTGY